MLVQDLRLRFLPLLLHCDVLSIIIVELLVIDLTTVGIAHLLDPNPVEQS